MLQAVGRCVFTIFMAAASVEGDRYCGADAYFDGVLGKCVPCSDICQGEIKVQYCTVNCPDYIKRNTTSPSYEAVDNRNSKIRVELDRRPFILETSASLDVTVLTQSAAADPDPAESQTNRNLDLMTLSFVVASLFLVVMLLIFSFLAVFVFCRCSKRGGGRGRRWPTQKSLLLVGENDDSMMPVLSTASSAAVTANAKHCGTDLSSDQNQNSAICYLMFGAPSPTAVCQLPLQKLPASSSVCRDTPSA